MADLHFEPYALVAGLTSESVLIAWGGFWFRVSDQHDGEWEIVDDEALQSVSPGRHESIGEQSEPFGRARVEVLDDRGEVVATANSHEHNHVWVRGLSPDTAYRYRIWVDDEPWAVGRRMDWVPAGRLHRGERSYPFRFRTHPGPDHDAPATFVVMGDYGVGIRGDSEATQRQRRLAHALDTACDLHDVRFVLTTGDNIYHIDEKHPTQGSGDEDDDWFFTYYQPYRYVINRIPVYPSVGNHDTADTELSDDRAQLADNFFLPERFPAGAECSLDPGLFYRFRFGKNIELTCVDTSCARELAEKFYFEETQHAEFLERAFPADRGGAPRWRIPFSHHPPYCAGPKHGSSKPLIKRLVPMLERAGVRAMFSGHEHNFQLSRVGGIDYFVSGAGGKLRPEWPTHFSDAHTVAWSPHGHFLLVSIEAERMLVRPICGVENGRLRDLELMDPEGRPVPTPLVVTLER